MVPQKPRGYQRNFRIAALAPEEALWPLTAGKMDPSVLPPAFGRGWGIYSAAISWT